MSLLPVSGCGHGNEPVRSTKLSARCGQVSSSKKCVVALPAADGPAEISRVPAIASANASPPAARHVLGWQEKFHIVSIHKALLRHEARGVSGARLI